MRFVSVQTYQIRFIPPLEVMKNSIIVRNWLQFKLWTYLIFPGTFKCFHHLALVNFLHIVSIQETLIPKATLHPPNQTEKPSWASTSTSEFSEEEIFSWFNSNCTILQTQTHEKQSGNRKMYNSFGVIQNNKKDLTARYIVHYVLTTATSLLTVRQFLLLIFSVWPFHSWKNQTILLQ